MQFTSIVDAVMTPDWVRNGCLYVAGLLALFAWLSLKIKARTQPRWAFVFLQALYAGAMGSWAWYGPKPDATAWWVPAAIVLAAISLNMYQLAKQAKARADAKNRAKERQRNRDRAPRRDKLSSART